jgi:hypothetical protein
LITSDGFHRSGDNFMAGIEKRPGTYDKNMTDIRNFKALRIALIAILSVWSIIYFVDYFLGSFLGFAGPSELFIDEHNSTQSLSGNFMRLCMVFRA